MDEIKKFAIFLETMRIVSENKIPYYCVWVRKFIRLEWKNQELSDHDKLMLWSDSVARYRNLEDWQIDQAEEAIKIFLDWRVGKNSAIELRTENHSSSLMMAEEMVKKTRELIRLRHYSYRTEGTYLSWIERYIRYGRDQQAMLRLPATLKAFLTYLAVERKVSKSTQSQAFNALLFLFREVLKIDVSDMGKVVRSKRGPKLPVVLTVDETRRLFRHTSGTSQLMLKIIYGGGLRVSELTRLRVQDIDFQQNLIHVRVSKGDVDRATLLAVSVRDSLTEQLGRVKQIYADDISRGFGEAYLPEAMARKYSKAAREWHWQYIFPSKNLSVDPRSGKILRHHISDKAVQGAMSSAVKRAKIEKQATVHSLRHSFATHMLMRGVNIRQIQEYLGHKNVETTMIYTHVIRGMSNDPQSPLDLLDCKQ